MSEAIAWPLGKLQLKCWRTAAARGGRGRRITSLSTTSSRPPPANAASQPASRIHSRRAASTRPTASAKMVSVTAAPRELIVLNTAYPVGVAPAGRPMRNAYSELGGGDGKRAGRGRGEESGGGGIIKKK